MAALAISFLISLSIVFWMVWYRPTWLPLDHPNSRSLHQHPMPRAGGLAVMIGAVAGWLTACTLETAWAGPTIGLTFISWLDDRYGLPIGFRLVMQVLGALVFLWMIAWDFSWPLALGTILGIIWGTNLYNFMDGADGLAGSMAVIGFSAYAVGAGTAGDNSLMMNAGCLAAAVLGFAAFNFPPAKIFMGDSGSIPIGFLAGTLGLLGWQHGTWPVWFPVLVFSPFIVDATLTLLQRIARRQRFWEAHRDHAYQKLVRSGWSHRRLLGMEWILMIAAATSAVLLLRAPAAAVVTVLSVWMAGYAVLAILVELRWQRYLAKTPS